MYYMEITKLPLLREGFRVPSAAAIAARLQSGEVMELRLCQCEGAVHIYIGLPTMLLLTQTKLELDQAGAMCVPVSNMPPVTAKVMLNRPVTRFTIPQVGKAPLISLQPKWVRDDSCIVLNALARLNGDCGVVMLLRRTDRLDLATQAQLNAQPTPSPELQRLMYASDLMEAVICVYGSESRDDILAAETAYAFGLEHKNLTIFRTADDNLFQQLQQAKTPLEHTYLMEEIEKLTDLSAFSSPFGLPLNKDTLTGERFPIPQVTEPSLRVGMTSSGADIDLPLRLLRQHLFLAGAPGSGKGNELFSIAVQLHQSKVPFLILESAKQEFHHLKRVMPIRTWRPTEGEYVFSPFTIPDGITLQEYRSALLQMIRVAFHLDGPLEELFSDTLNRCFAKFGYTDCGSSGEPFGIHEFMLEFSTLLEEGGYSAKTKSDMKTAGLVRLKRLLNQNPAVFDSAVSVPVSQLTQGENLLQLNCLISVEAKQMFATLLLISLGAYMRASAKHCSDCPLRFVVLLDESHNLLDSVTDSHGSSYCFADDFRNLLLELRSVGIGFVVADQSADNIPRSISDVCATKLFMGSSASSGITSYAEMLNLDEEALSHLYLLEPGEGCCSFPGLPHALFFRTANIIDRFDLSLDCKRYNDYISDHPRSVLENYQECKQCPCQGQCQRQHKINARQRSSVLYQKYGVALEGLLEESAKKPEVKPQLSRLKMLIFKDAKGDGDTIPTTYCTLVQFTRLFNRERRIRLSTFAVLKEAKRVYGN